MLDGLTSPNSKAAYSKHLTAFFAWLQQDGGAFSKATVQRYRTHLLERGLSAATINLSLSTIRKLATEARDAGLLPQDVAEPVSRVAGVKQAGTRTGNWLTAPQAEALLSAPDAATLRGRRDRALLAVLIGCGLRRDEVANLTPGHIQQRDGRWVIVDLVGKGNRVRSVPMPSWAKAAIDAWMAGAPGDRLFCAVNKGDHISGDSMTPHAILKVVRKYALRLGLGKLAPHDLRRTYAKLAYRGKCETKQIQLSLGHASPVTTDRYLGVDQDFSDAPCDHLGIRPAVSEQT